MHYAIASIEPVSEAVDCLIIGVFGEAVLTDAADVIDKASEGYIKRVLAKGDLGPDLGKTLLLYSVPNIPATRILLVYCGEEQKFKVPEFRKVISSVAQVIKSMSLHRVANYLCDQAVIGLDFYGKIRQTIELTNDNFYKFDQFKTQKTGRTASLPNEFIFNLVAIENLSKAEKTIAEAVAVSAGTTLTKDLSNLPANICTPAYMVQQAEKLAKEMGLALTVLDKKAIEREGMGAFLAVAQGSEQPPYFVVLEYKGVEKKQKPIVLVGKGVTFDSGGICIKPSAGMEEMKFDMAGAASVLGILHAVAKLKLPINVVGVISLTENLPSGAAIKPGDVVKSLSGQSIEIINTDAEGRLILADALTYSERFDPALVIDMATLTGAIIVALGAVATGLMSNDIELIAELEKAGEQSYDKVWPLPLWEDYQEQIDSTVADVANVGVGGAKSITAACFLSRFTKKFRWAHLDIAGTAWKSKDKMATGRPVALLVQFLINRCSQ